MLRAVVALGCLCGVSGVVRLPDPFGNGCSGAGAPKKHFPSCYKGKASILGGAFSEALVLTIESFDQASGKGQMSVHATGASPEDCHHLPFEKDGQDIHFDAKGCLSGTKVTAKYCSDQDEVLLHVSIPHMPVVAMPVPLTPTACP